MKKNGSTAPQRPNCAGKRFAVIAAQFYPELAELLIDGARRALRDCGVASADVEVFDVPGCFELPLACRNLFNTGRFHGLVALGAIIRGETPHFDVVARECARGIMDVQLATGVPIGFGVLTTETYAQAEERADSKSGDKGYAAAIAAAALHGIASEMPSAGFR